MVAVITEEDTLEEAFRKINAEIDGLRSYGIRREELPSTRKAVRCFWSNGSSEWYCGKAGGRTVCPSGSKELKDAYKKYESLRETCSPQDTSDEIMEEVRLISTLMDAERVECHSATAKVQCLDANELVIVGMSVAKAQALQPVFNNLPLYSGSFEAKLRGDFSLLGIEIPPPIRQTRLDDLDAQTIRALVEKAGEEA